jgi:hypothetical protein
MKNRGAITLLLILANIFLLPSMSQMAQISQGAENQFAAGSDSIGYNKTCPPSPQVALVLDEKTRAN